VDVEAEEADEAAYRGGQKPQGNNKSNGTSKLETKKGLTDYNYYLGSARQVLDYKTTTKFLINYIKKTFDYGSNIGQALKELKEVDRYRCIHESLL
jgi:hypothetical protein